MIILANKKVFQKIKFSTLSLIKKAAISISYIYNNKLSNFLAFILTF